MAGLGVLGGAGSPQGGQWAGWALPVPWGGPCPAPTEARAASRPRAGKAPLGWNICSMRSWFAERARKEPWAAAAAGGDASRGHHGEVAAGDAPGAPHPLLGVRLGFADFGDTWGHMGTLLQGWSWF